jgi:hypothetical protein
VTSRLYGRVEGAARKKAGVEDHRRSRAAVGRLGRVRFNGPEANSGRGKKLGSVFFFAGVVVIDQRGWSSLREASADLTFPQPEGGSTNSMSFPAVLVAAVPRGVEAMMKDGLEYLAADHLRSLAHGSNEVAEHVLEFPTGVSVPHRARRGVIRGRERFTVSTTRSRRRGVDVVQVVSV